ncbi:hypothetical protein [Paractinoplanes durhamensis]|uniref:hypothetical protein n=1 Tax=Paractinoplanes durhamensis TaxID=113563 RepID=UPI00363BF907
MPRVIWLDEKMMPLKIFDDWYDAICVPDVVARCTTVPAAWLALKVTDTQP